MAAIRDVRFGRIMLPTILEDTAESVGDTLEAVGGGVVPGERRPRPFNLSLPLYGHAQEADPYSYGDRVRRQIRSLMENTRAKMLGIVFAFAADPELDAWLVAGGGTLRYRDGGVTLSSYELELSDCYKVGSARTHRPARRLEFYDRRLSTTARDLLGTIFGTDFAATAALPVAFFPVGATDLTGYSRRLPVTGSRATLGGSVLLLTDGTHGEVVSFEQAAALIHRADDVVIFDRRGSASELALGYAARELRDGPVGYWRLGEKVGATVAADASPSNLPGAYVGIPELNVAPGLSDPDTGAGLRGDDFGIYARVPDAPALDVVGDLTIEGWLRPLAKPANLVRNASAEVDTLGWITAGDANTTATTFARQNGWAEHGAWSFRFASTSTAAAVAAASHSMLTDSGTAAMPVVAGRTYTARAVVNVLTAPLNGYRIEIAWYDAAGAGLSQPNGGSTAGVGRQVIALTAVAPAGAAFAAVVIRTRLGTSGAGDAYVDAITLAEGAVALAVEDTRPRLDAVLSKWRSAVGGRSYRFGYDAYTGELVLELSSNGTAVATARVAAALVAGAWSHVAVVYEAAPGRATFYRNGIAVGQVTGLPTSVFASTTQLTIGKWEADA